MKEHTGDLRRTVWGIVPFFFVFIIFHSELLGMSSVGTLWSVALVTFTCPLQGDGSMNWLGLLKIVPMDLNCLLG